MDFIKTLTFSGHSGAIYSLQYDGEFIYSASADKYVVRWNIKTGEQDKFAIKLPSTPYSILLIDNNTKLISGLSNGDIHIFDIEERKEIKFFKIHKTGIFSMAENPLKNQFYIADGEGTLSIWDTKKMELLIQLPFDCGKIRRITPSKDGSLIYLCCQDGRIRLLEVNYFNLIEEIAAHTDGVGTLLELNDSAFITGGKDAYIKVWDKQTKTSFKSIPAHNYMIYDLIRLNDNTLVSVSRDKTIKMWNLQDFTVLQRLDLKKGGHRHSVNCAVKIDDNTFATASDDARIIVWERKI
jgi:hypothetical protein